MAPRLAGNVAADDGPAASEVRIAEAELRRFAREVFGAMGLTADDAERGADLLVWANLRGVDSHGVLRLPWFVHMLDRGELNPRPAFKVLKETPAVLFFDADRGLGAVAATYAMQRAIEMASQAGIGSTWVANSVTPLAIGYYPLLAARADMIGLAIAFSHPNMAPFGARATGIHNGPLAIAVPAKRHRPALLDMATSVVAQGKVALAIDKGTDIPPGWALDKSGSPTTDPHQARIMVPFGGYKGSDLALMFECMTSMLVGDPQAAPMLRGQGEGPRHRQTSLLAAIDIAAFTDVERYKEQVDDLIECVKGLPTADGVDEVLVPGEPEDRIHDERVRRGIPLPPGTLRKLQDVASRFAVELPRPLTEG